MEYNYGTAHFMGPFSILYTVDERDMLAVA
jgi:hypothetical protein